MADTASNLQEWTVGEISLRLKRSVEDAFGHVRVRGELGRVVIAKSGHVYFDVKDEKVLKPFKAEGFGAMEDKDYDVIRDLAKSLNLGPSS